MGRRAVKKERDEGFALGDRSAPRVGADLQVSLFSSDFRGPLQGVTRDIGIGGVCVATASPVAPKSILRVQVQLPVQRVELETEGCWQSTPSGLDCVLTGLSFLNPTESAVDLLWDYVVDVGKQLAKFLFRGSELHHIGLDGAMGLSQMSRLCILEAGTNLYRQGGVGEGGRSIYLVTRGKVGLQVRLRDVREKVIEVLEPGKLFGGLPMLADVDHQESAVAHTDVRLLEVSPEAFAHLQHARPWMAQQIAFAVTSSYARRMQRVLEMAGPRRG